MPLFMIFTLLHCDSYHNRDPVDDTPSHCNIDVYLAFLAVWLSVEVYTSHYSQDFATWYCNGSLG